MTTQQLEGYLELTLPSLRAKFARTADEDDCLQKTIISLYKKASSVFINDVTQFEQIIEAYFNMHMAQLWYVQKRRANAESEAPYNPIGYDTFFGEYHPENDTTRAMEYLEYIDSFSTRYICTQYYIHGYTLTEIGAEVGLSYEGVRLVLQEGVTTIKEKLAHDN